MRSSRYEDTVIDERKPFVAKNKTLAIGSLLKCEVWDYDPPEGSPFHPISGRSCLMWSTTPGVSTACGLVCGACRRPSIRQASRRPSLEFFGLRTLPQAIDE